MDVVRTTASEAAPPCTAVVLLMAIDAGLLLVAFMVMNYIKRGGVALPPRYDQAILLLFALWAVSAVFAKTVRRRLNALFVEATLVA